MFDPELLKKTFNFDETGLEDEPLIDDYVPSKGGLHRIGSLVAPNKERLLKYGIAASLLLHLFAFTLLPKWIQVQPSNSTLKPGEKLTPVRMVELREPPQKQEPPPERPSAISDRNHTAKVERIPKAIPTPTPSSPLGNVQPPQKQIASLMPPKAPEAVSEPKKKEHPKKEQAKKSEKSDKPKPIKQEDKQPRKPFRTKIGREKEDLKNLRADLRPTAREMQQAFGTVGGGVPDFYPDGDVEEAVVDINTQEDRFFSYLVGLKHKIQAVWDYPRAAAQSGIGGQLTLEFSIAKEGHLIDVALLNSSGHSVLDQAALSAIRAAAPYNPFPASLRAKRLRIKANFIYVTGDFFRRM